MFARLKHRPALAGILLTAMLLFVGCAAPPPAGAPAEEAADAEMADGEMAAESTLVIAQTVDLDGLEPSEVNSRAEANLFGHMYATVYEITETGDIVPYLASDYSFSEDGSRLPLP